MEYSLSYRLGGFTGKAFSPLDLSPALWLSDTGSSAGTWPDISGNGRNATQGTALNQPQIITNALNGRQVRRFDGNDFLDSSDFYSSDITVFVVGKTNSTTTTQRFVAKFDFATSNREWIFSVTATNIIQILKNESGNVGADNQIIESSSAIGTSNRVLTFQKNGTNGLVAIDGLVTTGTFATSGVFDGSTPYRIGGDQAGNNLNGDIAEILIFSTALSTADRQRVERYLGAKYAITVA